MTLANFQSSRIIPVFADLLKMWLTGPQSMSSRVLGCRRSGPVDLYMLRWFTFSCTSSSLKLNVSSVLPTYMGILFSCSWVNTELKYVLIMCVGHVNVSGDNLSSGCLERSYIISNYSLLIVVRLGAFRVSFA